MLADLVQYSLRHRGSFTEMGPQTIPAVHGENPSLLTEAKIDLLSPKRWQVLRPPHLQRAGGVLMLPLQPTSEDVTERIR